MLRTAGRWALLEVLSTGDSRGQRVWKGDAGWKEVRSIWKHASRLSSATGCRWAGSSRRDLRRPFNPAGERKRAGRARGQGGKRLILRGSDPGPWWWREECGLTGGGVMGAALNLAR
jgi:hypothetical protein